MSSTIASPPTVTHNLLGAANHSTLPRPRESYCTHTVVAPSHRPGPYRRRASKCARGAKRLNWTSEERRGGPDHGPEPRPRVMTGARVLDEVERILISASVLGVIDHIRAWTLRA